MMDNSVYKQRLTDVEFNKLADFIYDEYGIRLAPIKKTMLEGRLQKRLRYNNIATFKEYIEFLFSDDGMHKELIHMVNVVTTNKTDFFRENEHFEFLSDEILPEFAEESPNQTFKVWSSASSSGEEPYTAAMVIEEFNAGQKKISYQIHATDLSTDILQKAVEAVYSLARAVDIPLTLKQKYLLKSKDKDKVTVRIKKHLRDKVAFHRLNLMNDSYNVPKDFDLIFCRNVLIYFDKKTQEKVINKLCKHLKPGGYFFLGHSESVTNMSVPLEHIKPTIFRKK